MCSNILSWNIIEKNIWPREDSNLRRRSKSTDMLYALYHHALLDNKNSASHDVRINIGRMGKYSVA